MKKKPFLISILLISVVLTYSQSWTWLEDQLSYAREGLSSAVLDDSIFYSGGRLLNNSFQNTVDIYDIGDNQWITADLGSSGRFISAMVSAGGKMFIAGGNNYPGTENFSDVDVFDKATGEWTITNLSQERSVYGGVVSCGNKVFFAGGHILANGGTSTEYTDVIDIYDVETNTWSTNYLSVQRGFIGSVAVGNKVYFAGGATGTHTVTDVIDIYDIETEEWTVEYLTEGRAFIAAVSYNNKIYFAGGCKQNSITSTLIEVYDVTTGLWDDPMYLQSSRLVYALNVKDALVFAGVCNTVTLSGSIGIGTPNGIIEVYYPETGHWDYSVPNLNPARILYTCTTYDNKVYFAGGWTGQNTINTINILEWLPPKTIHVPGDQPTIQAAIDIATHGDTILVDEGTYYENINFMGKAITVASQFIMDGDESHIENTIIDGSQSANPDMGSVVTFDSGEDTTSVITGFTITGGWGTDYPIEEVVAGAGISCAFSGAKILNNIIENNHINSPYHGIGCAISQGAPNIEDHIVIRDNIIRNNTIIAELEAFGSGINTSGHAIIENNMITENTCTSNSDRGGGAVTTGGETERYIQMVNNTISNNTTISNTNEYEGAVCGGAWVHKGFGFVRNNLIENNTVQANNQSWAPGILIGFCDSDLIVEHNTILNNKVLSGNCFGGGICLWHGGATLNYNLISGNTATHGGGIYATYASVETILFDHNTIANDTALMAGGGIYVDDAKMDINNTILWGNNAPVGSQYHQQSGQLEITYSDIQGGLAGSGNIDLDPLFEDPTNGDYHLTANSPCIDAGDPACAPNPDLTRCDMGAYYFDHVTLFHVPGDVPTIQEGINIATHGDTILVAEGTYYENINFMGKAITVASHFLLDGDEGHIENTVIDGSQPVNPFFASVVTFGMGEDTTSILCGFTITGGTGYYMPAGGGWPAIRAGGGIGINLAGPKIIHNRIISNTAIVEDGMSDGAGISCGPPGTPYLLWLEDNLIQDNYSYSAINPGPAGVSVFGPAMILNNTITNNLCESQTSQCGPSGLLCAYGNVTVKDNIITHNKAYSHQNTFTSLGGIAGGAGFIMSAGIVQNNTIEFNRVKAVAGDTCFAAGVLVEMCTSEMKLESNTIANNGFTGEFCYGGGVAIWYGGATLHNNMIYNDSSTFGAGICLFDTSAVVGQVDMLHNTVTDNYASMGGKGLFAYRTHADIRNTIFWNPNNPGVDEIWLEGAAPIITYSVVPEAMTGEGNIHLDPKFEDPVNFDFHLSAYSPCINAGGGEIDPPYDFEGDLRPFDTTAVDIGADETPYYYPLGIENYFTNVQVGQINISPNPASGNTSIIYTLKSDCLVDLSIYDLTGKKVLILFNENKKSGIHNTKFDSHGLENGLYFCVLKTNKGTYTTKLIKL